MAATIQPLAVAATRSGLTQALGADMKIIVSAFISAALLCSCTSNTPNTSANYPSAFGSPAAIVSPALIAELSSLLSKNRDLKEAHLVVLPPNSTYMLVPVFDGPPNMTSLYEAVELFKQQEPSIELGLALLTPAERKRLLSGAQPFYVRP